MRQVAIKECVGIKTFTKADGKVGTTIFYVEPFPVNQENVIGMQTGDIFTYEDVSFLKVGDKFKAYYDKATFAGEERAILADLVVCNPTK